MLYLMGGSPRRVVLIGTTAGGPARLCRIVRVGRRGGWFLLEQPLVGHRDYVVFYGWAAAVGGSYWNNCQCATEIMSYLTPASLRRVVLIGTLVGGSPRLCRILRVGPRGGWFLLE